MASFRVLGINHLGLAPKDPNAAGDFFAKLLGLNHLGNEEVSSQKTDTRMYASGPDENQSRLEILAPLGGEGPIAAFLEKKGSGIHHVALTVDNVAAAIEELMAQGVKMIDSEPRPGAHNTKIAFVHPHATGGLLVELVQQL